MSSVSRRRLALVIAVAMLAAMMLPSTGLAGVTAQTVFAPDTYEAGAGDDTTVTAAAVPASSYHTLETSTTSSGDSDDVDWARFYVATTGTPVAVEINEIDVPLDDLDIHFDIYKGADAAGNLATTTPYEGNMSHSWNDDSSYFATMTAGWYYTKVDPGDSGAYWLHVTQGDARRIYGADRYLTAAAVNKEYLPGDDHQDTMIIASGADFADALCAGDMAFQNEWPLLLTAPTMLPSAIEAEVDRIALNEATDDEDPLEIYIVGGTKAVSTAVENQLKAMPTVGNVWRLAGTDRFGTAVKIADETSETAGDQDNRVFLANGLVFADALAAAPVAGDMGNPILLSQAATISSGTIDWMKSNLTTEVVVCGGPSAIATSVLDVIQASVPDTQTFVRLGGIDRYETAYKLARYGVTMGSLDGSAAVLVSGANFPDGLTAISIAYKTWSPILLTVPTTLSASVENYYKDGDGFDFGGVDEFPSYVIGGPAAVSANAYNLFRDLWKKPIN